MMRSFSKGWVGLSFVLLVSCSDKAKPDFDKCVEADTAGALQPASDACTAAVSADPTSVSGKAAAEKLVTLKVKLAEKAKADEEARAKAQAEAAAKAKVDAEAKAVADAKAKVDADAKRASICADLETWLPPMSTKARDLDGIFARFTSSTRAAGATEWWDLWDKLSKEAATNGKETRQQQATLKDHGALNGEGPILKDILRGYDVLAHMYEMYSESLADTKTPKGYPKLMYIGKDLPKLTKTTDAAVENARARCGKLSK